MYRKLKILIVDDEHLARLAFRKIIEDNFPSYEIIGEAETGPEGLALFREKSPDIVIMDIEMPDLNGIETSRIILQENATAQIIILSAYDNFNYVQSAINSGILGYLLKPVQRNDLQKLLENAIFHINLNEALNREHKEYQIFRSLAIRDLVSSFIYGKKGGLSAETYASLVFPVITSGYFLLFRIGNVFELEDDKINKINCYFERLPESFIGYMQGPLLPVFIRKQKTKTESRSLSWEEEAELLSKGMLRRLQLIVGNSIRVGCGRIQNSPELFSLSYRQAFDALQSDSNSDIILYSDEDIKYLKKQEYPEDIECKLIQAILYSDSEKARKECCNFRDWILSPQQTFLDSRLGLMELLFQLRRQKMVSGNRPFFNYVQTMLQEVALIENKSSQVEWFEKVVEELFQFLNKSNTVEEAYFRRISEYFESNDLNKISLENAAEAVGLTPQYLSRIFKSRFKVNFIDYIIKRRIEFACYLLKTEPSSVREIAVLSGYNDVSYFGKVFRKETGLTPREYRYQHQ